MKCPSAPLRTVALSLSLLAACRGAASGPSSTSRDSAGVTIVENHGGDRPLDWKLQQIATIENGAVGGIQLSQLTEYTVDADTLGHIYVNDAWYGQRVQLVDTTGRFIRALTRNGGGPGEVGQGVSIGGSGDTLVYMTISRLAIFDMDGTLTQTAAVDDECFLTAMAGALGLPERLVDWSTAPDITDSGILGWLFERHRGRAPTAEEVRQTKIQFVGLLERRLTAEPSRFDPVPGACAVFERLRGAGWTSAIATGAWGESARLKLAAARIPVGTVPIAGSDTAPTRAELLRRAVSLASARTRTLFERVVSVGDALWDVEAAAVLGVPFVGIAAGERAIALRQAGTTHVLPDLSDLTELSDALDRACIPTALQ